LQPTTTALFTDVLLLGLQDEREALEALCFLSASSCQLEEQAVQAQLASNPGSPKQQLLQLQLQQQGQHSKGSSFTAEAAAAPMQLSSAWLAAGGARQPSPGSDVSSDGCQGALLAPEQQQQRVPPLEDIHPGAHPVDIEQLAPAGTQQPHQAARKGSRKQQQQHPHMGQEFLQQQQQLQGNAMAFEPLVSLHNDALLAVQQAASASRQHQQAVHAPAAAVGLHQPLLQAQLASLLQANNYDAAAATAAAAAAAAVGLSSAQPVVPLQLPQQPQQQAGLSELLGLLSVGLPHAGVQHQQLPLLHMPATQQQQQHPPMQSKPVTVKRPPVKGCYWHVYIANMIAAGRREQEAKQQQQQEVPQQVERNTVDNSVEQQQQLQGLAMPRKSGSSSRLAGAAEGGSPCKRQKRQESPVTHQQPQQQQQQQAMVPQLQLPPAPHLPNWLAAAGVLPPGLALAAAAAAAAATAAGQAGMLPSLLQAPALSGPLAAAAASSMGLLRPQGPASLPLLGMPAAAAPLAGAAAAPAAPELLLQLLSQQHNADGAAAVRPAAGMPAGLPLGGMAPGLLQAGGFAAGALLQALAAPGMGLVAQQ
jgi:hypothetical protein